MTMRAAQTFIAVLFLMLPAGLAAAQSGNMPAPGSLSIGHLDRGGAPGSNQPLEISAADALEWNRAARTYTARGDALAKQGDMEVHAARLVARYGADGSATDIIDYTAEQNVVIRAAPYTGYGDRAVYTIATRHAVLTGRELRIMTPAEYLTAEEKIEFFGDENRLVATGAATAVRGTDRLTADRLTAFFRLQDGKMSLHRIEAEGNVRIATARETVHGDRGTYDIPTQEAGLTGRVRILQGDSWIEGTRAVVDLKTGISRLFADAPGAGAGRVKGVFYPKQKQQQKSP